MSVSIRRLLVLSLLAALIGSAFQAGKQPSVRELIGLGLQKYQAGDAQGALDYLRQAVKMSPSNPDAQLYLGLILLTVDPASLEAQSALEAASPRFPNNPDLLVGLLESYLATGKKDKQETQVARIKAGNLEEPSVAFRALYTLVGHGQWDTAGGLADEVWARLQLALSKSEAGTERAAQLNRDLGQAYFLQGLIAAGKGNKPEALRLLQEADKREFPARDSALIATLAGALDSLGEARLAAQAYEEYLKHFPADDTARLRWGLAIHATGQFESALAIFRDLLQRRPGYPMARFQAAAALLELKQNDEAERLLNEELAANPSCFECLTKLAYIEYLRGNTETAQALLEKSAAIQADYSETFLVRGLIKNRLGQYEEAIPDLENVLIEYPDQPAAHLQLSIAYSRTGKPDKAREHREIYNRVIEAQKKVTSDFLRGQK